MRTARILIVVAVAILVPSLVALPLSLWWVYSGSDAVRAADGAPVPVPARLRLDLKSGTYEVYAQTGTAGARPAATDVRVVADGLSAEPDRPENDVVPVTAGSGRVLSHQADEFVAVARFTVDDGEYTVVVTAPAGARVRVVPDDSADQVSNVAFGVLGIALGVVGAVLAAGLLAGGLVLRARSRRTARALPVSGR